MNRTLLIGLAMIAAPIAGAETFAVAVAPSTTAGLTAVAGKPVLMTGAFDLAALEYQLNEFFLSGNAQSYSLSGEATSDGAWQAKPAATATGLPESVPA